MGACSSSSSKGPAEAPSASPELAPTLLQQKNVQHKKTKGSKATRTPSAQPNPSPNYDRDLVDKWGGPMPVHYQACMEAWPKEFGVSAEKAPVALVTGGTSGIGFYVVKMLAKLGYQVVMPQRPGFEEEATSALHTIQNEVNGATVAIPETPLDLASFASVRAFAAAVREGYPQLDILCCHAGRGGAKGDAREVTGDGHEAIMQVNTLSHAVLIDELLPVLKAAPQARVILQTSGARLDPFYATMRKLKDLNGTDASRFSAFDQYRLSKAGGCLFTRALNEKLVAAGTTNIVVCVSDPGLAATGVNAQHNLGHSMFLMPKGCMSVKTVHATTAQHAADGALPMVLACVDKDVARDGWYAPEKGFSGHGMPILSDPVKRGQPKLDPLNPESAWPKDAPETFWRQMTELTSTSWSL